MSDTPASPDLTKIARRFMAGVRQCAALKLEIQEARAEGAVVMLPYSDFIIGNVENGAVHGGAITTLMDQACGLAVACALAPHIDITPTIDLRVDHLRQSERDLPIYAFAEAYRVTKTVVFCRGYAWQTDKDQPLAYCTGTFMRMGLTNLPWTKGAVK